MVGGGGPKVTYLVDSSVWLERLLEQESAEEVGAFLDRVPDHKLALTDFTFHSICLIALRADAQETLTAFVQDAFVEGNVTRLSLAPEGIAEVVAAMRRFDLDFDDGYQYVAAERHDLDIVSFDDDFDDTGRGQVTPGQVARRFSEQEQSDVE